MRIGEDQIFSIAYHDRFDYPLTEKELEKWRAGKLAIGRQSLVISYDYFGGYFFLKGREKIIEKRQEREKISQKKLQLAKKYSKIFKLVPTIKFVGITGSLAMMNADEDSDIDLMVITRKGALWMTRAIILIILIILKIPIRRFGDKFQKDKLCLNIWLDESELVWPPKDKNFYTAHEIAQIVPLINKDKTYERFLWENRWILDWWPKAVSIRSQKHQEINGVEKLTLVFERLAFRIQYLYMKKKITNEVVTAKRAIFHPTNIGKKILSGF